MNAFCFILCGGLITVHHIGALENLAQLPNFKGTPSQSTSYPNEPWGPDKAVDGLLQEEAGESTCSFTVGDPSISVTKAWWKFPLLELSNVAYLQIYFRNGTVNRNVGFSVYLFNESSFEPPNNGPGYTVFTQDTTTCPNRVMNITVNKLTQGVALFNAKDPSLNFPCDGYTTFATIEVCEVQVMGCFQNNFGDGCISCDTKCLNNHCDAFDGSCIYGCNNTRKNPPECYDCMSGFFGPDCDQNCGQCKIGTTCNSTSGICPDGCKPTWGGLLCDICKEGFYGPDCSLECGKCNNTVCNNISGTCPEGCQVNWNGPKCDVCENGFYGQECALPCGQCQNGTFCKNITGDCPEGCQENWQGNKCDECSSGQFGTDCNNTCGNCVNGSICNPQNGTCTQGCQEHWSVPMCNSCESGYFGPNCSGTCAKTDSSNGCHAMAVSDSDSKTGLITGLTLGILAVLFIIGSALVSFRLRQRRSKDSGSSANPLSSSQFGNVNFNSINNEYANISDQPKQRPSKRDEEEKNEYYNTAETCTDIQVSELQWIIKEKSEGQLNVFHEEYKKLPAGKAMPCIIGQRPENAHKNRFKTTFPYDHSRVVLHEKWSDEDGDYINANYIRDFKEENRYLAAQGPKSKTLLDFWRLIWQENIECIVMLTNLIETGKNKCTKYWPDRGESMKIGHCSISLVEETKYAFFVVRKLSVHTVNSRNERYIVQLHFTSWPDHGTPEEISLVQFHRAVEQRYRAASPLLVHCSAGVGRTGTFIGYDALLRRGKDTGRINVFEFVRQMREDRMSMVQTQEQYICLHKALACGFVGSERAIQLKNLDTKIKQILKDNSPKNQQILNNEFKLLSTWKTEYRSNSPEDRNNSESKHIAEEKYRAYLSSYIKGRTDYINAVVIPSYTYHKGFILTNTPLPQTEIDVWRLIVDHDVDDIVVFDSTEWIPQKGTSRTISPYTITYRDIGSVNQGITQGSIHLSVEGEKRDIEVYKMVTGNQEHVIQGVKLLLEKSMRADVKTLLMSRDGAGPAGLFAVLHNALQQLRIDEKVDIFNTVMQIQSRRPEVIASLEEYRSCYQMVLDSRSEEVYANV